MKFKEHNDEGIELVLNLEERELLYYALRHFSAYGTRESYILDEIPRICEILNVLHLPEFDKVK